MYVCMNSAPWDWEQGGVAAHLVPLQMHKWNLKQPTGFLLRNLNGIVTSFDS